MNLPEKYSKISNHTFFKVFVLGTGNILNAGMGFLYVLACARALPVNEFGKYVLLTGVLVAVAKILDFGTNSFYVTQSIKSSDLARYKEFINAKYFLFGLSLVVGLLSLAYLKILDVNVTAIFTLGVIGYFVYYLFYGIFHKSERFYLLLGLNFIPGVLKGVAATLIFLNVLDFGALGYFSLFVGALFSILILLPFIKNELSFPSPDFSLFLTKLKSIYKAGISQFITESWPSINSTLLKNLIGLGSVAIYSIADKMSDVFSLVSLAIFTVLLPKNARNKSQNVKYNLYEVVFLAAAIIILAIVCYGASVFVIDNFLDQAYKESITLLGILIFNSALVAITAFMEHHFYIEEKPGYLLINNSIRLTTLLIMSLLLVPVYGVTGLAVANITSTVIGLGTILILVKKINVY